ncbi:MAG: homocysteine biosynthesis protein [Pseudomonadota bacterium]
MPIAEKSLTYINNKILNGEVVVLTEEEFIDEVRKGRTINSPDIDVITIACQAAISGTAAMLCVPVAERGVFTRAKKIWLNGILGFPGPAPNERLGLVDTLIFADQPGSDVQVYYDGARLLLDIINRKKIQVECLSVEGDTYRNSFTLDDLEFARIYSYNFFLDPFGAEKPSHYPGQFLRMVRVGSKIILNKAPGIVIGCGTHSTPERKALSLAADMFEMDPRLMSGLGHRTGISITNTLALGVPVTNKSILDNLATYIDEKNYKKINESMTDPEKEMACYLKELILKERCLLTESDMELKHWV